MKKLAGGEYIALCPAHDDKNPSLTLKQDGNKILLHCQAGCSPEAVTEKLGITTADLFPDKPEAKSEPKKIIATYDYLDGVRTLLFQVVRYQPKSFAQRRPDGKGGWLWNLNGTKRVLYHLPDILGENCDVVYLVEGEKDADSLWNHGKVATTSPGGANNWKPEFADFLAGKKVVIIPDKDTAGFAYARQVAKSLQGKAREIKSIILPGEGVKDISDWLDAGGDVTTLLELEQDVAVLFGQDRINYLSRDDCIFWDKLLPTGVVLRFKAEKLTEERTGIHGRVTISLGEIPLTWSYFNIERREERSSLASAAYGVLEDDLAKIYGKDDLRGDLDIFCAGLWDYRMSLFVPEMMAGDANSTPLVFICYPWVLEGGGTITYSPPGRGKSWWGLMVAVSVDAGCSKFWPVKQVKVLFINLERSKTSLRRRLGMVNRVLGLPANRELMILNARGKTLAEVLPVSRKYVKHYSVGLVILDSISRAGVGDLTENAAGNRVVDTLNSLCPSWLALGHTPRQSEGHLYGSIMQDAGADICVQLSSQVLDNGTLGIGLEITKQNDTGKRGQEIYGLEFDDNGLTGFRKARPFEFPEVAGKAAQSMEQTIIEFVKEQERSDATATQIADATGLNRQNVSQYLHNSGKFVVTRKGEKNATYYGLKVADREVSLI